jgi:hypothetical protein
MSPRPPPAPRTPFFAGRHFFGVLVCAIAVGVAGSSRAALIASYQMNSPSPLANSAGATLDNPNFLDPGGSASPTFLSGGGANGSGAYRFDGVNDYFAFNSAANYTFIQQNNLDWTVSFLIQTADGASNLAYAGTPEVPVFGNDTGSVGFGLGIDGGKAAYRRYNGSWFSAQGNANVADDIPHLITFVAVGSASLTIYVDGVVDASNLPIPGVGFSQLAVHFGRSYNGHYGAFMLDDVLIYTNALSAGQVGQLFAAVPEPSVAMSALLVVAMLPVRRRFTKPR